MSNKQNDILWDLKREQVEMWLEKNNRDMNELMKDEDGFYILVKDQYCTSKDPRCEADEFCGCRSKKYLPEELQKI